MRKLDETSSSVLRRTIGVAIDAEISKETYEVAQRVKLAADRVDAGQPLTAQTCAVIAVMTGAFRLGGVPDAAAVLDVPPAIVDEVPPPPPQDEPTPTAPPEPDAPPPPPAGNPYEGTEDGATFIIVQSDGTEITGTFQSTYGDDKVVLVPEGEEKGKRFPLHLVRKVI